MPNESSRSFAVTRTGHFPIGFRRGWSEWQKDLRELSSWALENRFGVIDLGKEAAQEVPLAQKSGLRVGSVDLPEWKGMISPDKAERAKALEINITAIKASAHFGPLNYFLVMLPDKPELPAAENFGYMVESFGKMTQVLESNQAKLVIEGWPGPGALCCTPESLREFFRQCPSSALGINYDPSHLIRMGIDSLRFLQEFAERVYHVHGKDTELLSDEQYHYGNSITPLFGKPHAFGAGHWRYTVPGQGVARWSEFFRILVEAGYKGAISIELEDENFNGSAETEKQGLLLSRSFLEGC